MRDETPASTIASTTDATCRPARVEAHRGAEARHDMSAIMASFGPDARFHWGATVLERRPDIHPMDEMSGFAPSGGFAGFAFDRRGLRAAEPVCFDGAGLVRPLTA